MSTLVVKKGGEFVKFGEKLKELRLENNLTQKQLAERLGIANSIISYYESGNRFPSYDVLVKISKTFHVTCDYLLGIEKAKTIDVSELSWEDVKVVEQVANALRRKNASASSDHHNWKNRT